MIDAPMTAREEALKASHAELKAVASGAAKLVEDLIAGIGVDDDRLNRASEQLTRAITNAERIA